MFKLTVPVVFFLFNKPDTTKMVFEKIREAKPTKLFLIADGPRVNKEGEFELCNSVRSIVANIDWKCEVYRNFSSTNLGCKQRISSGLDWVFRIVEEAIILEDDCLPHYTFFQFCQEMLEKYRDDDRIMMISGDNLQFGRTRTHDSYYYSLYTYIWGWATWRRAWKYYDVHMEKWPQIRDGRWLLDIWGDISSAKYWHQIFESVYSGRIDTWDYQWTFSCWINSGLTILPNINLVSNLGVLHPGATHTTQDSKAARLPIHEMKFPLSHPAFILRDRQLDMITQQMYILKQL